MVKAVEVFVLRCGACGFAASSLEPDRTKATMLEHLIYAHGTAPA